MPSENLAKIFGPTVLGYSSADPDQHAIFTETMIQRDVSSARNETLVKKNNNCIEQNFICLKR